MSAHTAPSALSRGRAAFERQAWVDAHRDLRAADTEAPLDAEDLDRLATASYLIGRDVESIDVRARAHARFLERGDPIAAARSAFWVAFALADRPDSRAQAGGWLARARRLVDECGRDCVEQGLILCGMGFKHVQEGEVAAAREAFEQAAAIGSRFRDPDVTALARHGQARGLIRMNHPKEGFALLDEVMVAVTGGEVAPIIAGTVYCSVISACYDAFDLHRAQEWTAALARWCASHPDIVPFRAHCLVRRSELLQLHGAWQEAVAEAQRASDACARASAGADAGAVCYQQGELYRVRGEFARADECFRQASQAGRKPYPGLALLRLAQGELDAADALVRRMLLELTDPRVRARVLGACVDVMLARDDAEAAHAASDELSAIARELDAPLLRAAAAYSAGAVALASGKAPLAMQLLRESWSAWQELDAPYEVARTRAAIGLAYRHMGDADGAQMELEAAQETFERLGAAPDAARIERLLARAPASAAGPLTGRELEVLRLVARGKTNRQIASDLAISEKTVARHMSNIFTKLDLPSRAAATAYAYERKLV